jgi:hypothetical protein
MIVEVSDNVCDKVTGTLFHGAQQVDEPLCSVLLGKPIQPPRTRGHLMTASKEEEDLGQTQEEFLREMLEDAVEEFGLDSPVAITLQQQLDALTKEPDYVAEQRLLDIINGSSGEKS